MSLTHVTLVTQIVWLPQTELHLSQLFLAPCVHDIIMNLLPVEYKFNVVWKFRLSRLPSILNIGGMVAEVWGSLKVQDEGFTALLELGAFSCNDGTWVRLHMLPLSLSLLKEIPNLSVPKQDIDLGMTYSNVVKKTHCRGLSIGSSDKN